MNLKFLSLTLAVSALTLLCSFEPVRKNYTKESYQKNYKKEFRLLRKLKRNHLPLPEPVIVQSPAYKVIPFATPDSLLTHFAFPIIETCTPDTPPTIDFMPTLADFPIEQADSVVEFSKQFLGVRYRSRGMSAKGFDCSSFTSYVMAHFGHRIPAGCNEQAKKGELVAFEKLNKGDLMYFGYKRGKNHFYISHVGMVVSEQGEKVKFIHASRRGIVIDEVEGSAWRTYYKKRYLFSKRILNTTDNVIMVMNNGDFEPKD